MSMVNFCVPLFMARAYNVRVCVRACARACIIYMYVYRAAREKKSTAFTTVFFYVEEDAPQQADKKCFCGYSY